MVSSAIEGAAQLGVDGDITQRRLGAGERARSGFRGASSRGGALRCANGSSGYCRWRARRPDNGSANLAVRHGCRCRSVDPDRRFRAGPLVRPRTLVEPGRSVERGIPVFLWGVTWRFLAQQARLPSHFASPSNREASVLTPSNGCRRQLRDWRDRPPQRARLGQRLAVADGPPSGAPSAPSADRCRLRVRCAGVAEQPLAALEPRREMSRLR